MTLSIETILRNLIVAACLIFMMAFFYISFKRIAYPFELEWIEGGILEHVQRVVGGQKIFVEPSVRFISFIYPPLYYWVSALVAKITGISFFPLRLVSLLSTIGIAIFIYKFIYEETKNYFYSILGVGFFFAVFRISGAWYDTARVDMLFHLFVTAFLYYLKNYKNLAILVGLFFLAYITKQVILFTLPGILIYLAFEKLSLAVKFLGISAVAILIFTLIYNSHTDGWYVYSTITNIAKHAIYSHMILGFWTEDLFMEVPFLVLAPLLLLYFQFKKQIHLKKADLIFYIFVLGNLVGLSWIGRIHQGGYNNVLITGYIALCLVFSVFLFYMLNFLKDKKLRYAVYLLILLQFWMLRYDPRAQIPTQKDLEAGQFIIEEIKKYDGDVWVPYHPYLAVMAEKPQYLHIITIMELTGAITENTESEHGKEIVEGYRTMIIDKKFDAIMLDSPIDPVMHYDELIKYYPNAGAIYEKMPGKVGFPVTGMETRPMSNHLPIK